MSALARLSTAAGGVAVLLAGSAMIASAHTAATAPPAPQAEAMTTHQTSWEGNGKDNLPCTGGTLHWIFTGGDKGTFADLYIDGVFADAGTQAGGSGNGAWHFYTSSAGVTNGPPRTNVYVSYDGAVKGNLVISHCEEGTTTSTTTETTSTTSTAPTTSETTTSTQPTTETTSTSTVPTTSETTSTTVPTTSDTTTTETTTTQTSTVPTTSTTTIPTITTDTAPTTSTTSTSTSTSTIPTTSTTIPTITTDTAPTTSTTSTSVIPTTSTTTIPTITTDTAPTTSTTSTTSASTLPTSTSTTPGGQTLPSESTRPGGVVPTAVEAGLEGPSDGDGGGPSLLVLGGLMAGLALLIGGGWSVIRELRRVH
jgi:hypothetical protein